MAIPVMPNALWFIDTKQLFTGKTKRCDERKDRGRRSDRVGAIEQRCFRGTRSEGTGQGRGLRFSLLLPQESEFMIFSQTTRHSPMSQDTDETRLRYRAVRT